MLHGLPSAYSWRYMILAGVFMPAAMLLLVVFVMPESPRWLIRHGKRDDAADVLRRVYSPGTCIEDVVLEIEVRKPV